MRKKKRKKLHSTVLKVLKPIVPNEPEKAEISVHEADDLYREIRIEKRDLTDENGERVRHKPELRSMSSLTLNRVSQEPSSSKAAD